MPVIKCFSESQRGQNFGERITAAIEEGFAKGFDRIIICGTDSPSINAAQFKNIAQKLAANDLVIAPSADGGINILGIQKNAYDKQSLLEIPWLTKNVFQELKNIQQTKTLVFVQFYPGMMLTALLKFLNGVILTNNIGLVCFLIICYA